jgi:hypothetical protein
MVCYRQCLVDPGENHCHFIIAYLGGLLGLNHYFANHVVDFCIF